MNNNQKKQQLNEFLKGAESSAFKLARSMLRNNDDALDAIQDAMLKFVNKYSDKPIDDWNALFYRIVQNRCRDMLRRRKFKNSLFGLFGSDQNELERTGSVTENPELMISANETRNALELEMNALPKQQQNVLRLRLFENMKIDAIADCLDISSGSVKTHLSRAMQKLRPFLAGEL